MESLNFYGKDPMWYMATEVIIPFSSRILMELNFKKDQWMVGCWNTTILQSHSTVRFIYFIIVNIHSQCVCWIGYFIYKVEAQREGPKLCSIRCHKYELLQKTEDNYRITKVKDEGYWSQSSWHFTRKCHPHVKPMLVTYTYRIHNFDLTVGNLVNMYILFLLQVVFSYFVKNKKKSKRGWKS